MEKVSKQSKVIFSMVAALGFLFWLSLDSDVFGRSGGGRSSGSRGYSSGGSYQRSPSQSPTPLQRDYQQPSQQPLSLHLRAQEGVFSPVLLEAWLEGFWGECCLAA